MIEPVIVSLGVAALGVTGIRLLRSQDSLHAKVDMNSERLAGIEGRLGNGLAEEVRRMKEVDGDVRSLQVSFRRFVTEDFNPFRRNVEDHIAHEEDRILQFCAKVQKERGEGR
jgi:hypothetical protein